MMPSRRIMALLRTETLCAFLHLGAGKWRGALNAISLTATGVGFSSLSGRLMFDPGSGSWG